MLTDERLQHYVLTEAPLISSGPVIHSLFDGRLLRLLTAFSIFSANFLCVLRFYIPLF
jgi:hypothetical protein